MAESPFTWAEAGNDTKVRAHLAEITQSSAFCHAPQLRSFLEFLVTETLAGRADELKEANLGRDVFRRGPGYDPRSDAIVRVQASILRKRLAAYYEGEGQQSPLRILLPKGGYVPSVEWKDPEADSAPVGRINEGYGTEGQVPMTVTVQRPVPPGAMEERPSRRWLLAAGASFVAGSAATVAGLSVWEQVSVDRRPVLAKTSPSFLARQRSPRIWGQLLQPDLPVQLAFGCPQFFNGSGVYVRDVTVNDTSGEGVQRVQQLGQLLGKYLTPVPNTYTGVGEMRGIHHITRFLAYEGIDAAFENAQLLTPESITGKTLILVSSHRFRTLLDLIALPRTIRSSYEQSGGFVLDELDGSKENVFRSRGSGGAAESYALVSFWTQPSTGGKILLLSGIDSWATYGAAVYITSPPHLDELERKLESSFPDAQAGVQVLLQVEGHDNQLTHVRYHTHRLL